MKKEAGSLIVLAEIMIYVVIAFADLTLGIWFVHLKGLLSLVSDYIYMAPATAIILIFLGISILFWHKGINRKTYRIIFSLILSGILSYTVLMLMVHYFNTSLKFITNLYNPEKLLSKVTLFELSPLIAMLSILIITTMLLSRIKKQGNKKIRQINLAASVIVYVICFVIILGYISGVPVFHIVDMLPVGLPAVFSFLILNTAIQFFRGKDGWIAAIFNSERRTKSLEKGILTQSTVYYFVLLALVISLAGAFLFRISYNVIRVNTYNNLKTLSTMISEQITEQYGDLISDATVVQTNPMITDEITAIVNKSASRETKETILNWMRAHQKNYEYDAFTLYDRKGSILLSTADSARVKNYQGDSLFASIADSNKIRITEFTDPRSAKLRNQPNLNVWIPASGAQNQTTHDIIGVWQIQIDPDKTFSGVAENSRLFSKTGESIIFHQEANDLIILNYAKSLGHPAMNQRINSKLQDFLLELALSSRPRNVMERLDYRKIPVFLSISPILGTPWQLLVKIDKSEVYKPLKLNMLLTLILVLAILSLLAVIIGLRERNRDRDWYKEQLELEKDKKIIEKTLQEVELSYRNILDNLLEGCQIIDPEHRFVYVNKAYLSQADKPKDKILKAKLTDVFPGIETTDVFQAINHCFTRQTPHRLDTTFVRKDGTNGWMRCKFQPSGSNVLVLTSDITEQKLAELEIKKMNEELEQKINERTAQLQGAYNEMESFSYSVSHDLRSPLRSISSFSEVLETDYKSSLDEKGKDFLNRIRAASKRMNCLIDDILQLSRISRTPLNTQQIKLLPYLETLVAHIIPTDSTRKSEIVLDVSGSIIADQAQLEIALVNILENAWKFTSYRELTKIRIYTEITAEQIKLNIQDNGAGFDMKYAEKLFTPFQRLHKVEEFPGTGIGLTIVQRIMQKHNGAVNIESQKDTGTTVYLTFNQKGDKNEQKVNPLN